MSEPDEIEAKIQDCLQSVARDPNAQNWSNAQWTREVTTAIARLGIANGFDVWAAGCDAFVRGGEWLYDAVWLKYQDGCLARVGLVMEFQNGEDGMKLSTTLRSC